MGKDKQTQRKKNRTPEKCRFTEKKEKQQRKKQSSSYTALVCANLFAKKVRWMCVRGREINQTLQTVSISFFIAGAFL